MSPSDAGGRPARSALLLDLIERMRDPHSRCRYVYGGDKVVYAHAVDGWADELEQVAAGLAAGDRPSLTVEQFRAEVIDKLSVVFYGCNGTPLHRATVRKQCEDFLVERYAEAVAVAARPAPQEPDMLPLRFALDNLRTLVKSEAGHIAYLDDECNAVEAAVRAVLARKQEPDEAWLLVEWFTEQRGHNRHETSRQVGIALTESDARYFESEGSPGCVRSAVPRPVYRALPVSSPAPAMSNVQPESLAKSRGRASEPAAADAYTTSSLPAVLGTLPRYDLTTATGGYAPEMTPFASGDYFKVEDVARIVSALQQQTDSLIRCECRWCYPSEPLRGGQRTEPESARDLAAYALTCSGPFDDADLVHTLALAVLNR